MVNLHTYKIPLKTTKSDKHTLQKVYWWMFKLHNKVVAYALKCFNKLNDNIEYKGLLQLYHNAEPDDKKIIGKQLNKMQAEVGLTKAGLEIFVKVQQKKYSKYISSQQAQKEANRVWEGVAKVLYSAGKTIHFKKATKFRTITGKSAENGIKFRGDHILFGDLNIHCKLEHSDYEKETLNNKIKYCELVRDKFRGGYRYYVNLYLDGKPPVKHKIGEGSGGLDSGVSSEAFVSKDKVILTELSPKNRDYNKLIKKLQREIERSVRMLNPNNYNKDGILKSGKHHWIYSDNCKRKKWLLAVLYRKKSDYMRHFNNHLANEILTSVRRVYIEKMNYSALAKKTKKAENPQTEEERCKRRKRYGKSMNNHAPAQFKATLKHKLIEQNGSFCEVNTKKCKASQFNHVTGEYIKTPLDQRFKNIGDTEVQRDLYSAFLLWNTQSTLDSFNTLYCNLRFERFVTMQNDLINTMKTNNVTMKQCFGF